MEVPEGPEGYRKGYWKLKKTLYRLKQSGRLWNETLDSDLNKIGLIRLKSEPCIYYRKNKNDELICILAVYVDDILITDKETEINEFKPLLKERFTITDIGLVDNILGIKFVKEKDGYTLYQLQYLENLLKKFNIEN